MKTGIELIVDERRRQILQEGWTPEHDDEYKYGELTEAAIAYTMFCGNSAEAKLYWPWKDEWWKPSADPVRNLVKAGALIAAEIDRLQRLKP